MRRGTPWKPFPASPDEVVEAVARAPERIHDPECPYDPNDPVAVETFWKEPTVRRPGHEGKSSEGSAFG
jgi:hypothetical protein